MGTGSKTPEGSAAEDKSGDDKVRGENTNGGSGRSGMNLQERLLSCGTFTALLDDDERVGRRPSITSVSTEGRDSSTPDEGYFHMKRVHTQFLQHVNDSHRVIRV